MIERIRTVFLVLFLFLAVFLAACRQENTPAAMPAPTVAAPAAAPELAVSEATATATIVPPSPTPVPPTPTPTEPVAALVNDEPIFLATYEKELARYEMAQAELGQPGSQIDYRALVLDALIERSLIAQAAEAQGIVVTSQMVDEKLAELRQAAGETGNFEAWLNANQWTEAEFREALAAEMLAGQTMAVITADVPYAVEHLRARYLQVDDLALAQTIVEQVRNGADFAFMAAQHSLDRVTGQNGGDLGYFTRGSLLVPEVEAAAFALQPGETSDVIAVTNPVTNQPTYYLAQVIERDPQRPLTPDLRYNLLQQAFEAWLQAQWEQASIVRFVDVDA